MRSSNLISKTSAVLWASAPKDNCLLLTALLFICRAVAIAIDLKDKSGTKLKDFRAHLEKGIPSEITDLKDEVEAYASRFPTIGFEKSTMSYQE